MSEEPTCIKLIKIPNRKMVNNMYTYDYYDDYLMHYGVKGMKWGVRSKAAIGAVAGSKLGRVIIKTSGLNPSQKKIALQEQEQIAERNRATKEAAKAAKEAKKAERNTPEAKAARRKTALKVGAAAAGTVLAAYGAYKASEVIKEKAYKINSERAQDAVSNYMKKYNKIIDWKNLKTASDKVENAVKSDRLNYKLTKDALDYVDRHSSTTTEALKTVLGKNREFTTAELLNMGISVAGYEGLYR